MDHLPIFLDIRDRKVVVDGGGTSAARRVERALSAGAEVTVFDPAPEEELRRLIGHKHLTHVARVPQDGDFDGCLIAYGASEDEVRDRFLHQAAKSAGALVNVADVKPLCDFITPSVVDRSPVTIAISTGGAAPIVARILRARIEALLPTGYGRLAEFLSGLRGRIEARVDGGRARRRFWERMIEGPIGDAVLTGDEDRASHLIDQALDRQDAEQGGVWLIGTGSGDPELLTFRALGAMQRADVVFHDGSASPELLALTRRDAERRVTISNSLDIVSNLAQNGQRVVCLLPGDAVSDPSVKSQFARLAAAGVEAHLIPGVQSDGMSARADGKVVTLAAPASRPDDHAMSLAPRQSL
ncbi:NAD(P)-dependent oxidoreductase [Aliiroseovarius sp. 2305UL8-7]|uniref:NAD(P)-dependent oxidoreductase n=1 Tax=Aliiroseovarius conchicola TaxID=3121637 RepID=UPI0035282D9C